MPSIYLIRHGQASFGKDNYDQLSKLGKQQAARLGTFLNRHSGRFDVLCSGTMTRHQQTAQKVLEQIEGHRSHNADQLVNMPEWNEYDHQALLARLRPEFANAKSMMAFVRQQAEPQRFFERCFNAAIDRWASGDFDRDYDETWPRFNERVSEALKQTIELSRRGSRVAVFTSGGPISLVALSLLGMDARQIMKINWTLLNCGITKLVVTSSRTFLASLNEHSHFDAAELKPLLTYS